MDFDSSICERYRMIGTCWTIQTEVAHTHTQSNKYLSRRERMDTVDVARWRIARQLEWKLFLAPFLGFHRQYTQLSGLSFSLSVVCMYLRNFFWGDMLMKLIATVASETYIFRGEGRKWSNEVHGGALLIPLASAVDPLFFQIGKTLLRKR